MYWTEREIVYSYKTCEDPRYQPQILAELNSCSIREILDVLRRNGIDTSNARKRYVKDGLEYADDPPTRFRYKYSKVEIDWLKRYSKGKTCFEITNSFNRHFGADVSVDRIRTCLNRYKIDYKRMRICPDRKQEQPTM